MIYMYPLWEMSNFIYVNQDGAGHFREEAMQQGLDNSKTKGRKTAGFSISERL